jgi:predicted O-methyltransferase YrrM
MEPSARSCGQLPRRAVYAARAAGAIARSPAEGLERLRERVAERRERREPHARYVAETSWVRPLHDLLDARFPCDVVAGFWTIWFDATAMLATAGLVTGRGSYGGWDDADAALARALWCIVIHLRPRTVLETGVARGMTTRVALEAIARNDEGRLWSIDVPPLLERDLGAQTGAAVPAALRDRWELVRGSSRRRLPSLIGALGSVDVFVHDSMHTARNVSFELERVWPALRPGGVILVDDVGHNDAFAAFTRSTPGLRSLIAGHDDGRGMFGVIKKAETVVASAAVHRPTGVVMSP